MICDGAVFKKKVLIRAHRMHRFQTCERKTEPVNRCAHVTETLGRIQVQVCKSKLTLKAETSGSMACGFTGNDSPPSTTKQWSTLRNFSVVIGTTL